MLWKLRLAAGLALALGLLAPQAALGAGTGVPWFNHSMGTPRYAAVAAPLKDGRVLVAGATTDAGGGDHYLASAETFDPIANTFSSAGIGAMGSERGRPAAAPLPDGRVLVVGGDNGSDRGLERRDLRSQPPNTFSSAGIGAMGSGRAAPHCGATPRRAGAGRRRLQQRRSRARECRGLQPRHEHFHLRGDRLDGHRPRRRTRAAPLPDGRVLIAGGIGVGGASLSSVEVFNPATNTFSSAGIGSMGSLRAAPAAAPLPDGRVLVAGGYDDTTYLRSAEVFDPATNTFSSARIGAMATARAEPAAAPLPDGRVLVAGGFDGSTRFSSAEIFAATNAFQLRGQWDKAAGQRSGKRQGLGERCGHPARCLNHKKKRRLLLKSSDASGDPPTITAVLDLSKLAKKTMRRKGKVAVRASITFAPQGGLANTQTAKLKIKGKKRK